MGRFPFGEVGVDGAHVIVEPAGFGTVDKIGNHVKGVGMVKLRIDDVGYGFVVEIDLQAVVLASSLC